MGGILLKQLLYLYETMLLSQLYSKIPLVEQDTAIDSFLGITKLDVGVYSLLAESHRLELLSKLVQDWRLLRKRVDYVGQVGEVFHLVVGNGKALVVVSQLVVFSGFCPLLSFSRVISEVLVDTLEHLIITSASFNQLQNFGPVTKAHAQLQCQILPLNVFENLLSFVVFLEKASHFCLLFDFFLHL